MTIYLPSWCPEPILQELSFLCKKKNEKNFLLFQYTCPIAAGRVSENTLYEKFLS